MKVAFRRARSHWPLVLVAVVLIALAVAAAVHKHQVCRSWPRALATIETQGRLQSAPRPGRSWPGFSVAFSYRYQWGGVEFVGEVSTPVSKERTGAWSLAGLYAPGTSLEVLVDPSDPSFSLPVREYCR